MTLDELCTQHYARILSWFLYTTRSREEAEDLTQQTFLRISMAYPRMKHMENVTGWVNTVAINIGKDARRRQQTRQKYGNVPLIEDIDVEDLTDGDPQEIIVEQETAQERRDVLMRRIGRLKPEYQHVLLADIHGQWVADRTMLYTARRYLTEQAQRVWARKEIAG